MPARPDEKVLLVGWDAADWSYAGPLVEAGELPRLASLIEAGSHGSLTSPAPLASAALWTSLATGKRAQKHGVLRDPSAFDVANGHADGTGSRERRVHAIWNLLTHAGLRSVVAGWPATHPAEPIHGAILTDRYAELSGARVLEPEAVHPPRLRSPLSNLRVEEAELAELELLPFFPHAGSLDGLDPGLQSQLAAALAENATLHAAATRTLEKEAWSFAAVRYSLVGRVSEHFLEYCEPRMAHVSERDARLYGQAVAAAYRFQDRMLGRLLDLAGPETSVVLVSDHGAQSGAGRVRPGNPAFDQLFGSWRRPLGMLALSGARVRPGVRLHGAHLLDVTPTLLAMFGLPVGNDMDGRALRQAFSEPLRLWSIRSWEEVRGDFGTLPTTGGPGRAAETPRPQVALEPLANLALAHLDAGEVGRAVPLLEELAGAAPQDAGYAFWLAQALHRNGARERAWSLVDRVASLDGAVVAADLLRGLLLAAEGQPELALEALRRVEAAAPETPGLKHRIGASLLELDRWREAELAFLHAIEREGDDPQAHHGLAVAYLRLERHDEARAAALRAVDLQHFFPDAHFHLGVALAHGGQQAEAVRAFETCLRLRPRTPEAHRWLGLIHERAFGDHEKASFHRRQLEQLLLADQTAS